MKKIKARRVEKSRLKYSVIIMLAISLLTGTAAVVRVSAGYQPDLTGQSIAADTNVLTWNAVDGVDEYSIWRATYEYGSYMLTAVVTGSSYWDQNLNPDTTYYYRMSFTKDNLYYDYGPIAVTTQREIQRLNLTAEAMGEDSIYLAWDDIDNVDVYEIFRSLSPYGYFSLVDITFSNCTYIDYGLMGGTTYYYKVVAIKNESMYTEDNSSATTYYLEPPILEADAIDHDKILLSWSNTNADKYVIYRKSGGPWEMWATVVNSGNWYETFMDTGIDPNVEYTYYVEAAYETPYGSRVRMSNYASAAVHIAYQQLEADVLSDTEIKLYADSQEHPWLIREIYRRRVDIAGEQPVLIHEYTGSDAISIIDSGLTPNARYSYELVGRVNQSSAQMSFSSIERTTYPRITFNANGGTNTGSDTIWVKHGDTAAEPSEPVKASMTFAGWHHNGVKWDFNTAVTENIYLTAKWATQGGIILDTNVSVQFDSMGGSEVGGIFSIKKGERITAPAAPVREGYTFSAWYLDKSYGMQWDFAINTVDEDIVLYAGWDKQEEATNPSEEPEETEPEKTPEEDINPPENETPHEGEKNPAEEGGTDIPEGIGGDSGEKSVEESVPTDRPNPQEVGSILQETPEGLLEMNAEGTPLGIWYQDESGEWYFEPTETEGIQSLPWTGRGIKINIAAICYAVFMAICMNVLIARRKKGKRVM